jgi:cytochrome c oxidase assembly protein subunit 15
MSRIRALLARPDLLRVTALAGVVANLVIVVTGGVVRLSGSGLGCPTWPHCMSASYVTTSAMGWHGMIEFGNRTLTFVVEVLAVAVLVMALSQARRDRRQIRRAAWVFAAIPAQAVLGGLTVLTHLNPWLVAAHFLLSMAVIVAAHGLWVSVRTPPSVGTAKAGPPALRALSLLLAVVAALVLTAGTVTTGSGPHAGDEHARRTGLDPGMVAQLHTDLVMVLIGLSVALWFALRATGSPAPTRRAAGVLVLVELAQGVIGFVQYLTHLPALLVGFHVAGACAVWLATLETVTRVRTGRIPAGRATPATGPEAGTEREAGPDLPAGTEPRATDELAAGTAAGGQPGSRATITIASAGSAR